MVGLLSILGARPLFAALDPGRPFSHYLQDVWSSDAGLPQSNVTALAQTADGYLWVGTEEGLARFDGVRFTTFDTHNTPALKSNRVATLLVDSRKRLWIGTDSGGLTLYAGGKFTTFSTHEGLPNDAILSLFEDLQGVVWVGTDGGGLNCVRGTAISRCEQAKAVASGAIFSIAGARDGSLWLGTHDGLVHLSGGNAQFFTRRDGLPNDYIKSVHVDSSGTLWVGTNGGGLSHLVDGRFTTYTTKDGLASNSIWSIYEDTARTIWVSTSDGGISRFAHGRITTYAEKDGLPYNKVLGFLEDHEGNFWIGTGGAGLVRLKSGAFFSVTKHDGLSDDVVLPVFEDRDGAIWLGTNGGGLNRIRDGQVTVYTTRDGLLDDVIFSIAQDRDGAIWVATAHGVNRFKDGRFSNLTGIGLPSTIVSCLFEDHLGVIWTGSRGGLSQFDGTRFTSYTTADGLSNNHVTSIYEDARGALWVGTAGGGLNKFIDGRFTMYSTKSGLSSDSIRSLNGDPDGTLWIATNGGGLDRLKGNHIAVFTTRAGLLDDDLYQVLSDRLGFLWLSSNKGIIRLRKSQLDAYAQGRVSVLTPTVYSQSDGLKSKECNGGFQPAGWASHDGRLLFPTMKGGLAIVDPARLEGNHVPPPVSIERVSVDRLEFNPSKPFKAKPGKGQLEFEFTALSFVAPDKIRFRYKLEGFDKDWVDAGTRRAAYYTNIAPGEYRFIVIACNNDGVWNTAGASVLFTLAPHFYQTSFFIALCMGLVAALSLSTYRLRINHLIANEKKLVRLVNERTQSLSEEVQAKERARAELAEAQQHLMELSRRSGMAEVATGVLHSVGNVLNSVNVGASVISDKMRNSRVDNLSAALKILQEHGGDISEFIQSDPKGQRLLPYLANLGSHLQGERQQVLIEVEALIKHIDHIKEIVATQQDYAKTSTLIDNVQLPKLVEDAYRMVESNFKRHHVKFHADFGSVPAVSAARHRVLDILVNLLSNAQHAVVEHNGAQRDVNVSVKRNGNDRVAVAVKDSGVGLSAENLTRIFAHGFTTKREGHGFGLHSGALAAKQMGGSLRAESEGIGHGATFILELPVAESTAESQELAPAEMSVA